jgi:predicted alpha/beta-hydrolase family hydrolase
MHIGRREIVLLKKRICTYSTMGSASDLSLENVCTCKECNHGYAKDCKSCFCCQPDNHSMVLDGIEGFSHDRKTHEEAVRISIDSVTLSGSLCFPRRNKTGIVLFAHGSGSGRHSPRNRYVAGVLQHYGFGTLLFDLLTEDEEEVDEQTRHLRFDIKLLSDRLAKVTDWLIQYIDHSGNSHGDSGSDGGDSSGNSDSKKHQKFDIGYFGASTGAAAALVAAASRQQYPSGSFVKAIVSRGGRPDLAEQHLEQVQAATLLIVGGDDDVVIRLNQEAFARLRLLDENKKKLVIVPGASHLFEEKGKLEQVAQLAVDWFGCFLDGKYSGSPELGKEFASEKRFSVASKHRTNNTDLEGPERGDGASI